MSLAPETIDPAMFGVPAEHWPALQPYYLACHAALDRTCLQVSGAADTAGIDPAHGFAILCGVLLQEAGVIQTALAGRDGRPVSAGEFLSRAIHALTTVTRTQTAAPLPNPNTRKDLH